MASCHVGAVFPCARIGGAGRLPTRRDSQDLNSSDAEEPTMAELIEVSIPFSGSVENVEINEWLVEEGAEIREGQPLADVSTDKVDTELDSPHPGTVVRLLVEPGTEVKVGTTVALLAPS